MIDLGFIQIPYEIINMLVIMTALLLAATYIGLNIISTIAGILAVFYSFRVLFYNYELVIFSNKIGIYDACFLIAIGGIFIYRGAASMMSGGDINTWK